jgi:hypothetical protein
MAITTLNSAGSLYAGTSAAEQVAIESGAATNSTVNAAAGNDTIQFLVSGGPASNATALSVDANGGADVIQISGLQSYSSTILGGAGGDTISFSGASLTDSVFKAGDGSDKVTLEGVSYSGASNISFGAGADTVTLEGIGRGVLTGSQLLGGSGADVITTIGSDDMSAATILGGGGADSITLSGQLGVGSLINGDSTVNGGFADTITLAAGGMGASATIKGKGGADVIAISGTIGNSARVEGNAGGDSVNLSGGFGGANAFVGGGSGNDTILISGVLDSSNLIQGGGGSDSIDLEGGGNRNADYVGTGTKIYGGAGADTIELGDAFSGQIVGADATGVVAWNALSDSSLAGGIDIVSGSTTVTGINFALDTAAGITSFTIGTFNDSDTDTPSVTAGVVSGATWQSADGTVTARVTELDGLLNKKGTVVGFNAKSVEYLFIQGGTSGTADDMVVQLGVGQASGGTFNVATDYQFYVGGFKG